MEIDKNSTFKRLKHERPKDAKAASVMNLEATIDSTAQKLSRPLKTFSAAVLGIPKTISPEGQIVLQLLFSCFEKQHEVREGVLKDILFGFQVGGIPHALSMKGIGDLIKEGYLQLKAEDGSNATLDNSLSMNAWVRYTDKTLDLVQEGEKNTEGSLVKKTNTILNEIGFNTEIADESTSSK